MESGRCLTCQRRATTKWTLHNGRDVAIAELCDEHSAPLQRIMDEANVDIIVREHRGSETAKRPRTPKGQGLKLEPFDWAPPS